MIKIAFSNNLLELKSTALRVQMFHGGGFSKESPWQFGLFLIPVI
jgi:hypothetical protein